MLTDEDIKERKYSRQIKRTREKILEYLKNNPSTIRKLRRVVAVHVSHDKFVNIVQRMRVEGLIVSHERVWYLPSHVKCPHCNGKGWTLDDELVRRVRPKLWEEVEGTWRE
jgi:hypothetical protein